MNDLTMSQRIVLSAVDEELASAYIIRDRAGLPPTGSAVTNVRHILAALVRQGVVHREAFPHGYGYRLKTEDDK